MRTARSTSIATPSPGLGRHVLRAALAAGAIGALAITGLAAPAQAEDFVTLPGHPAPGTPDRYNKVQVLKQGPARTRKVLVLIPGTSAGASNFQPMAQALLQRLDGWQVWSIERRENLLEDTSVLKQYRNGRTSAPKLIDYYLGWLTNPAQAPRFQPVSAADVPFAYDWGLNVAVQDVRRVVRAANKGGRSVVLGGHSLGGRIAAAYASWDFDGRAGARDLDGLVFIDGSGASTDLPTAAEARQNLAEFRAAPTPFSDLLGLGLPWVSGIFNALGSTTALRQPDQPSTLQGFPLVPGALKAPVPATNLAQYGYSVDADTSPDFLALVHSHIGSLATSGDPRGWVDGELGSARRAARVFAAGPSGRDGTSWYHPARLSLDARSVNNGVANPAQQVYGVKATRGRQVDIPMYGFDAALGQGRVSEATRQLARIAGVPRRDVVTVDRSATFGHIDPLSAAPDRNVFVRTVARFLDRTVAAEAARIPGRG